MRIVAIAATLTLAFGLGTPTAHSAEGPWCARFWGGDDYWESCSMRSFEMCLREIRGTGGNSMCSPNPNYHPAIEPRRPLKQARPMSY
jgi:hypothetical protein